MRFRSQPHIPICVNTYAYFYLCVLQCFNSNAVGFKGFLTELIEWLKVFSPTIHELPVEQCWDITFLGSTFVCTYHAQKAPLGLHSLVSISKSTLLTLDSDRSTGEFKDALQRTLFWVPERSFEDTQRSVCLFKLMAAALIRRFVVDFYLEPHVSMYVSRSVTASNALLSLEVE